MYDRATVLQALCVKASGAAPLSVDIRTASLNMAFIVFGWMEASVVRTRLVNSVWSRM